jgi:predicted histone-like DNA-binding protein
MSVRFKMVPKQNNIASPPQTQYYPCVVSSGGVDLEFLAEKVSSRSTLTRADCYAVMVAMTEVIGEELARGRIVKIDQLGSFSLTLKGTGTDDPERLNKNTIIGAKILFKPAQQLKIILKNLTYKRIR